jgi:hypothetical protein
MQSPAEDQLAAAGPETAASDAPAPQTPEARSREERLLLYVGFGTGLSVGLIFLAYIVLGIAGKL